MPRPDELRPDRQARLPKRAKWPQESRSRAADNQRVFYVHDESLLSASHPVDGRRWTHVLLLGQMHWPVETDRQTGVSVGVEWK